MKKWTLLFCQWFSTYKISTNIDGWPKVFVYGNFIGTSLFLEENAIN